MCRIVLGEDGREITPSFGRAQQQTGIALKKPPPVQMAGERAGRRRPSGQRRSGAAESMLTGEPCPQHRDIQFGRFRQAGKGGIGAQVG